SRELRRPAGALGRDEVSCRVARRPTRLCARIDGAAAVDAAGVRPVGLGVVTAGSRPGAAARPAEDARFVSARPRARVAPQRADRSGPRGALPSLACGSAEGRLPGGDMLARPVPRARGSRPDELPVVPRADAVDGVPGPYAVARSKKPDFPGRISTLAKSANSSFSPSRV